LRTITVDEGVPFTIEDELRPHLREACLRVQQQLATRFPVLEESASTFTIRGVVGTLAVRSGVVVDVTPKIGAGENWIAAVLDLLVTPDRMEIAGDRRAGLARHRNLLDVLATIYVERLGRALRRDGPILVMERRQTTMPLLKGKLQVSEWARSAAWAPHRFPVAFQELTADNEFSRGLARVATIFAQGPTTPSARGVLLDGARALRPGAPEVTHVGAHVALRRLPSQWAAYEPAWDIAVSVLSRRTLLGTLGARHGVSLAIEGWPLMERLLERALSAAVRLARDSGRMLTAPAKAGTRLLRPELGQLVPGRRVIPDGRLAEDGQPVATLEAKYARFVLGDGPPRDHVFQALSTAAACRSPLAVLVYPDRFEPAWWAVRGFHGQPAHLVAIGLGLFGYRRGPGDVERGQRLLDLLEGPGGSGSASPAFGVA
jgi:hypothetical protein